MDEAQLGVAASTLVKLDPQLKLSHVVGQPEAIAKLRDLLRRIKHPVVYETWGVSKPKAIALVGTPGSGKTLAIRALANEAECPLMELKYEDIASSQYDEAIKRLAIFKEQADVVSKEYGHVIILIDEADIFFQNRFDNNTHNSDEKKTTFFLRWIDGDLEGSDNFTIIAASNVWDTVDPAIKRSGRFIKIEFKSLSSKDILECIKVHAGMVETKTNRIIFDLTGLEELEGLVVDLTGADVKEVIDSVLLAKANKYLDLHLTEDPGTMIGVEEFTKMNPITVSDLKKELVIYTKSVLNARKAGF
jgi:ATP-dependent 26S proteasome regulatory subunit